MGLLHIFGGKFSSRLQDARAIKGARIIDVREPREYNAGHLPGAINVPITRIEHYRVKSDTPLYLYCRSGLRSSEAVSMLKRQGFDRVTNLGGIMSYRGPLEK